MGARPPAAAVAGRSTLPGACERLVLSRERLRRCLLDDAGAAARAPGDPPTTAWLHNLAALPGAGVVVATLQAWWSKHPLRLVGRMGAEAAQSLLRPLARHHPVALVLGATLLGAGLAWTRPWRWVLKPAWLAGVWPQLAYEALAQARRTAPR